MTRGPGVELNVMGRLALSVFQVTGLFSLSFLFWLVKRAR